MPGEAEVKTTSTASAEASEPGFFSKLGSMAKNAPGDIMNGFSGQIGAAANALKAGIIKEPKQSSPKEFKVSLTDGSGNKLLFDVSPVIEEGRQVNWDSYQITHLPANLVAFKSSNSRSFSLQAKLVSRDSNEANQNYHRLKLLRMWTVPSHGFFGDGSPPNILLLNGYTNQFKRIQVVLNSYSWSWPEDVDWIHTGNEPFPVVMNVSLSMQEVFSPSQLTFFDKVAVNLPRGGVFSWEGRIGDGSMAKNELDYLAFADIALKNPEMTRDQAMAELSKRQKTAADAAVEQAKKAAAEAKAKADAEPSTWQKLKSAVGLGNAEPGGANDKANQSGFGKAVTGLQSAAATGTAALSNAASAASSAVAGGVESVSKSLVDAKRGL